MKYVGIQTQIWRNNTKSMILLIMFPLVFYALVWLFIFLTSSNSEYQEIDPVQDANTGFVYAFPWITAGVAIWFLIAYFSHSSMIQRATGASPLERKENKRVYNLMENLCIGTGMKMPRVNIIQDDSLNAFASGINRRTYTVTLSSGIIRKLNDEELEGVMAHELSHIRNRDVRLLIVSIIFVGIFAFLAEMIFRSMLFSGGRRSSSGKGGGAAQLIGLVLALVGLLLATLFRFAISRKREYMADAGAADMTKNPEALASALRKISFDPRIEAVKRQDVAQLFIEHPLDKKKKSKGFSINKLFATHPPIEDRISVLEQF
ncbi:MAG: M48 family metallopeptidase [Bacteroidota bacterium]|nr:M48 family metallopeptidase [Bacteroidota bacterium]